MIHIFTLHQPPNDKGKEIYDNFKKTQKCFFVNVGNLKDNEDSWIQQNLTFETDYEDNLANLNPRLNELTTQYLAWKNLLKDTPDDEWVEFSHYRRWLNLPDVLDESVGIYIAKGFDDCISIE